VRWHPNDNSIAAAKSCVLAVAAALYICKGKYLRCIPAAEMA
jgi:hypothetical protein